MILLIDLIRCLNYDEFLMTYLINANGLINISIYAVGPTMAGWYLFYVSIRFKSLLIKICCVNLICKTEQN